ncbi:DEAD/DEAH box helicase [Leptotrichia sp. OH3620_COT-345]|uniref:helicase C-terminal domain-containing protein n=1 Tax=Leptotrichia sp. OH3620_COT-345 TaxID=2491048 RepID=UPI000F653AD6|nr:helicase C-terminal domain-containing protein [Leptotrichia sp. OH3620_COT-345]RRD41046.1 DEAD/DEAH box helicase [Leptotrichia sp. OH3620_COT-345]
MKIADFINVEVAEIIKNEIENSGGNEIFFRGIPDDKGLVTDVEVIARGNGNSVAALLNMMRKNEVIIHNHPSGILIPSNEDVEISSLYGESGGASYIVNNEVDEIYVMVPLKKYIKINIDEFFGENGKIHEKIKMFEPRKEQYKMSKYIEKCINENKKLIVEAGTGTGKTIAYLLPTLLYALENNLKLIISTNTINLQEQLINKDIPLIRKIIEKDFIYEIVKGRGNYLCKRKLKNINTLESDKDTEEEKREKRILKKILEWDEITETGDRSELKYEVPNYIWEQVNCEADLCTSSRSSDCYFFKARKKIANADMLIVNHHLFFADLSIRNEIGFNTEYSILPNYDIVVFDEAHNIEDTARNYFTYEVSRHTFGRLTGNIYNRRATGQNNAGALTRLLVYLNENLKQEEYVKIDDMKEEVIRSLNEFYDYGNTIFDKIIYPFAQELTTGEIKRRIDKDEIKNSKFWLEIMDMKSDFKDKYGELLRKTVKFLNFIDSFELEDENGIIFDFTRYFERLKQYFVNFEFILRGDDENFVYWLNINSSRANIRLYATPFDIAESLEENLFNKMNRMIFTSATLAVDNKFDYYKKSIGLKNSEKKEIEEKIITSPFDYEKQMKVYIPNDTLDPNSMDFLADLERFIEKIIKKTDGHCFLLFTSYSSMNYLYNKLKFYFNKNEYTLIKQNDYPRHEMIEIFKTSKSPVLFGTDSFWEGVDVQGEQLKSVIIVKLPFKVPNDPVTEAIIENTRKKGKNPFNDYQVPQAVIKFKQGVGRLIRSKQDTGIITILDNRIIKKVYGKKFLKSLPKNIIEKSRNKILELMESE